MCNDITDKIYYRRLYLMGAWEAMDDFKLNKCFGISWYSYFKSEVNHICVSDLHFYGQI